MQSMSPAPSPATSLTVRSLTLPDLVAAFATLPDPRRRQGRRFPLPALLALALVALLSNHLSVLAIAQWGKRQSPAVLAALGFPDERAPHQYTLHRLLRRLNPLPLAAALTPCFAPPPTDDPPSRGSRAIACDGKVQRGRLACAAQPEYPVHMLSAVLHQVGIVLAQLPLDHSGEKAEAERAAVPALIARLDWAGGVFTGDALYADTDMCTAVRKTGGDYLMIIKENQVVMLRAITTLFASRADAALRAAGLPPLDMREATTVE